MECHACEFIHVLGPYVLVAFFAIFIYRIIKRHQDTYAQMHARTMDVFERQNAVYERVHFALVGLKKHSAHDDGDADAPRKR